MTAALLLAAMALLGLGSAACAAQRTFRAGLAVQAVGAALLGAAGFWALAAGTTFGSSFTGSFTPRFGVDGLTAFFLGTLGLIAAPTLAFASRYLDSGPRGRVTASLTGVFVLTLAEVLCARDPMTFLAGWELMTLLPAALILVGRSDDAARRSVFLYIAVTHIAGAGTWIAILLAAHAGLLDGAHVVARGSGLQIAIALTALAGMGTKAGVMPLHSWLPRAHPIAPAPVSALMSGVMIKVAIYGLVRVLVDWLGVLPLWFGVLVLALGALSAVGGVVYALFQHDLKRLLAFHSIENVGIIVLGLGACLLLRARGADTWAALALAAALLHTLNHAVFKSLLFLGAGAFERAVGSLELDRLGGLLRRMPWTGGAFLVGSLAIAGVPPFNGFASEWLTLQALVHVPVYGGLGDGLAGALALAALAATAALAVFCFVKVVGLVLLGPPRRASVADATEAPLPMRAAVVALAGACVALGVVPGLLVATARAPRAVAGVRCTQRSPCVYPERARCPRSGLRSRSACSLRCSSSCAASAWLRPRRRGRAASSCSRSSRGRAPDSRSRCASCSKRCCAQSGRSPCGRRAVSCRRSPTAAASRTSSTSGCTRPSSGRRSSPPVTRGACRPDASARTSDT